MHTGDLGFVDEEALIEEIQQLCTDKLPSRSIPVRFVVLDKIPMTQSEKIYYIQFEGMGSIEKNKENKYVL